MNRLMIRIVTTAKTEVISPVPMSARTPATSVNFDAALVANSSSFAVTSKLSFRFCSVSLWLIVPLRSLT